MNARACISIASLLLLGTGMAPRAYAADRVDPRLRQALAALRPGQTVAAWVVLADRGRHESDKLAPSPQLVSERSLQRRAKVRPPERLVDATDLPLDESYLRAIATHCMRMRQRSKWLNRVSVEATAPQIEALASLPFVRSVEPLARFRRHDAQPASEPSDTEAPGAPADRADPSRRLAATLHDYGPSLSQLQQIHVPDLHTRSITGQGVLVGHFDNGYRLLSHESLAAAQIVAAYDFVDHDPDPAPPEGSPSNYGAHGINTLSVLAGYTPGQLVGAAFGASYVIARTENDASETPLEEDNWIAAIEWADSIGIDVASTSLGYLGYDPPDSSWTWEDMNGNTTPITRAADMAVARGIVVVNSAGNEGLDPTHNTLIAPADGDSVISAGAVLPTGERASFSSVGPTTDVPPRIKPDVMAQGQNVLVARTWDPTAYGFSAGTSFSCPLVAGVATLLLSARPSATPLQIRDALRLTASQAVAPDNLYGWGILDATAALAYLDATDIAARPPTLHDRLVAVYPNPFNPEATLLYSLAEPAFVTLTVFDGRGRLVRTLTQGNQAARMHSVRWNGLDDAGRPVGSGVYLARLQSRQGPGAATIDQRKLTLVR